MAAKDSVRATAYAIWESLTRRTAFAGTSGSERRSNTTAKNPDSVRTAAYAIWEARVKTGAPGDEVSDWLAAERLVAATAD